MQTPLTKDQAKRVGEACATFAELGLLSVDKVVMRPGCELVVPRAQDVKLPALNASMVCDEFGWREAKDGETPMGWFAGDYDNAKVSIKMMGTAQSCDDSRSDDAVEARLQSMSERISDAYALLAKHETRLRKIELALLPEA